MLWAALVIALPFFYPLEASEHHKAPMYIYVGAIEPDEQLLEIAQEIADHLAYSKQFITHVMPIAAPKNKHDITKIFEAGYPLALFVAQEKGSQAISWRLYDATRGVMCKGKRYDPNGLPVYHITKTVAHDVWLEMTGEYSSFCSCISYIKKNSSKSVSQYSLCLSDYNGKHDKVLHASQRIMVAPRWSHDVNKIYVVFSEFTPYNVRLLAADMQGRLKMVLDNDGTYVGVAYGKQGDVVYCRSGDIWHYSFDQESKQATHSLLIEDDGSCASPSITESGTIIYCSQGKIKEFNRDNKKRTIITPEGYCVAPSYSDKCKKIAYSRRMGDAMQLFMYDTHDGTHQQLTFDKGDKMDPSWSPCGHYIAYVRKDKERSQIGVLHVNTGASYLITPVSENCSYPAWSPLLQ